ncbi:trypsin-like peptidase domain-containing protein [Terrimonas sp. NA20]|uniref:Trypsin-like peptidase domain-containing protein n=1 Tax=Terrimonas ginsenosidimutans TaxID=2908004 RepID=A0ABS9KLQ2_9BACT|nr:trypsin-like peptidase domain-containing protein [Terrimonas ginsenosidimutans]MCG2613258.1 trypsin-like peptidase domain-containing protein [Terrimonas ginsenosidimutans]
MKYKQLLINFLLCVVTALLTLSMHDMFSKKSKEVELILPDVSSSYAGFSVNNIMSPFDFTEASEMVLPAVVHIKASIKKRNADNTQPQKKNDVENMFENFFGIKPNVLPEQRASGSGVIVTANGYIVTNNHVLVSDLDGTLADEIIVTLSDRSTHKATVVGRDPATDLALLKIDANDLPVITMGNSDLVKTGQWALAVGYPLGLDATVTAGIVSGKGRSIGINTKHSSNPVEDFIQTDAVINTGNSGGALVSADGKLIGINAAMLSANGSYAGYGFAIPVNLVKKVVSGFIKKGESGSDGTEERQAGPVNVVKVGVCSMTDDRWSMAGLRS